MPNKPKTVSAPKVRFARSRNRKKQLGFASIAATLMQAAFAQTSPCPPVAFQFNEPQIQYYYSMVQSLPSYENFSTITWDPPDIDAACKYDMTYTLEELLPNSTGLAFVDQLISPITTVDNVAIQGYTYIKPGEYNFQITATHNQDSAVTNSYKIRIVVTDCSTATFVDSTAVSSTFLYTYVADSYMLMEDIQTSLNVECRPQFTCLSLDSTVNWCDRLDGLSYVSSKGNLWVSAATSDLIPAMSPAEPIVTITALLQDPAQFKEYTLSLETVLPECDVAEWYLLDLTPVDENLSTDGLESLVLIDIADTVSDVRIPMDGYTYCDESPYEPIITFSVCPAGVTCSVDYIFLGFLFVTFSSNEQSLIGTTQLAQITVGMDTIDINLTVYACMLSTDDFVYAIPVEETISYYVRSSYIVNWTPQPISIDPLGTAPQIYIDGACPVELPIYYYSTADAWATTFNSGDHTAHEWIFTATTVGVTQEYIFDCTYANILYSNGFPTITRFVTTVDGLDYVKLFEYRQVPQEVDMGTTGLVTVGFTPPTLQDPVEQGFEDTMLNRSTYLIVVGHELEPVEDYIVAVQATNFGADLSYSFSRTPHGVRTQVELVVCYNYSGGPALQGLCDYAGSLKLLNVHGSCFVDHVLSVDLSAFVNQVGSSLSYVLGVDPVEQVTDLSQFTILNYETTWGCGKLGFMLQDQSMSAFMQVDNSGLVTIDPQTPDLATWEGTHEVSFLYYLPDIDDQAVNTYPLQGVTLTVNLQSPPATSVIDSIASSLLRQAPIALTPIEQVIDVYYGQVTNLQFSFADPIATASDQTEENLLSVAGLRIHLSVQDANLVGLVTLVNTNYKETGLADCIIQVDGTQAVQQQGQAQEQPPLSLTEDTPETSSPEAQEAAANESSSGSIMIEVEDLSSGGLTSRFTFRIRFVDQSASEDGSSDSASKSALESQADGSTSQDDDEQDTTDFDPEQLWRFQAELQRKRLNKMLDSVFESGDTDSEVVILPKLREINQVGKVFIDFDPPRAEVSENWQNLWSVEERAKMTENDKIAFENRLKSILHVTFVKNSEELDQQYFASNLTDFSEKGIVINLNFSDPLLISAGQLADQVKIKLLKSFFLTPQTDVTSAQRQSEANRQLARLEADEKYIVIVEDVPRQFRNEAELNSLQSALDSTSSAMQSQFAFTFALNMFLNGVMSQLWNIFNTLQIIMALPMLQVQMPSNIILVQDMLLSIINFQIISKDQLAETFIDPIMQDGKKKKNRQKVDGEEEDEEEEDMKTRYLGSQSMIKAVFFYIVLFLVVALLIAGLILCKCYILPKCPNFVQKLARLALGKLMFNSLLRAVMQTYFLITVSMWDQFRNVHVDSSEGITNLAVAILSLLGLLFFTIFSYRFLKKHLLKLPDPAFKAKYDSLYQNLDYYKVKALPNTFWFLSRRLAFSAVIVFCTKSIVLQVMLADVLSTLLLVYFLCVGPMYDRVNNCIQFVNEAFVLASVWMMFHYTEYVGSPETRYDLAFYFMYFIGVDVALNVLLLVYNIIKKVIQAIQMAVKKSKAKSVQQKKVQDRQGLPIAVTEEDISQNAPVNIQQVRRTPITIQELVMPPKEPVTQKKLIASECSSSSSSFSESSLSSSSQKSQQRREDSQITEERHPRNIPLTITPAAADLNARSLPALGEKAAQLTRDLLHIETAADRRELGRNDASCTELNQTQDPFGNSLEESKIQLHTIANIPVKLPIARGGPQNKDSFRMIPSLSKSCGVNKRKTIFVNSNEDDHFYDEAMDQLDELIGAHVKLQPAKTLVVQRTKQMNIEDDFSGVDDEKFYGHSDLKI